MSEFGVQDKEPAKRRNNNTSSFLGSVQSFEGLSNKKMMHQHHNDDSSAADSYGPTTYNMSSLGSSIDNGHVSLNLQPFNTSAPTIFNSPANRTTTLLGNSFTNVQWREFERQVMIYKYLVASLPIPSYLLSSITTSSMMDGDFNTRLSSSRNNTDPEAGRCRRTDGKKWRCSRYVAPKNKYCERHMHRGSHRSRKPVELHTNINSHNQIKRACYDSNPFSVTDNTLAIPNPTTSKYCGTSSHFLASSAFHPYLQPFLSLDNSIFGVKLAPSFDPSNRQPRGLDWLPNGDPIALGASNSGLHSLMHNNIVGMTNESSYINNNTESHYMSSFPLYNSSELSQQERPFSLLFNPLAVPMQTLQYEKPRGSITVENNANNHNASASIGKLSISSLDLSMGGPLAEVLRPSNVTSISDATSSNLSSPVTTNHVESIGISGTGMISLPL